MTGLRALRQSRTRWSSCLLDEANSREDGPFFPAASPEVRPQLPGAPRRSTFLELEGCRLAVTRSMVFDLRRKIYALVCYLAAWEFSC